MIDLPLLAPFLPEIGAALAGIALIVLAALIADKLAGEGGSGFLSVLTAPLQVLTSLVHNALTAVSNSIMQSQGGKVAHLLDGAAESIQTLIFYPARLWHGVHAALTYLWEHAIPGYVKSLVNPVAVDVHDLAGKLTHDVATLTGEIDSGVHTAETYADHAALGAKEYADHAVGAATATLRSEFNAALGKLQAAEDTAVAHAIDLATTAENDIAGALTKAEAYADTITRPIGTDLTELDKFIKSLGLPALIAAVPGLALLVQTIAAESGLDNAACRSKVKGICGTDASRWLGLLEGIAAIGVGFSLADIVEHATQAVGDASGLLADVGNLSSDTVRSVGAVIGRVAAGIAA